jgi:tetratricopeptide (TPR) repeat protein
MSQRTRVNLIAGGVAAIAVAVIVGATLVQSHRAGPGKVKLAAVSKPLRGYPPLFLDLGIRNDAETRALSSAVALYRKGKRAEAGAVFARYDSLPAQIGAVFAAWPGGGHGLDAMKALVVSHGKSAEAELHLGWAYYWSGRTQDAIKAWEQAIRVEPDSPSAVAAADPLHPSFAPGLPYIVTTVEPSASVSALPAAKELQTLERDAGRPRATAAAKLLYGVALWHLGRPLSAERQLRAAASLAPNDPLLLTAAAVGSFSKAHPVLAFSKLGPLTGRFPRAAVVRFHLGVLLLWTHQFPKARTQLKLAVSLEPHGPYAAQAKNLLAVLVANGTK